MTLSLVRHSKSGEVYVLDQHPGGHCVAITGPYYEPDYRNGAEWSLLQLREDHRDADFYQCDPQWADGEQFTLIAELGS